MPKLFSLVVVFTLCFTACARHEGPSLSDTLDWMDNTYNPHDAMSQGGHGRTGWYGADLNSEILVQGSTETFTSHGCHLNVHVEDDPDAAAYKEAYSSDFYSFNLRDLDPQSIKTTEYTHRGGLNCADYDSERREQMNCDHAEIVISTRNEAPLVEDTSRTIFPKLQGKDHESTGTEKRTSVYFEVDDVEYAVRLAKALRHAIELCGGHPSSF